MMTDWTHRARLLKTYLRGYKDRPFVWGEDDCIAFVQGWGSRLGYPDLIPDLRGAYDDVDASRVILGGLGGDLERIVTQRLERQSVSPRMCRRGDIVMFSHSKLDILAMGIVDTSGARIQHRGKTGLLALSLDKGKCGWQI